jgi:glycosyltransferase involved in cell wall biosynthesis
VFLIGGTGKDEYMQRLQHEFSGPQIRFLGFTEPQAFFAQIDVLLVPSIWEEPLGRVIYEGFANGVPAIVANIGGMPEIIDPGVTGYIVPPNDVDGLAVVLRQLVNEDWPTRKFADACYAASQRFGIDRIFEQRLADWVNAIECQRARGAAATHVVTG